IAAAVAYLDQQDQPLRDTYNFLKRVTDETPVDFKQLRVIFSEEVKRTGAKRSKELEDYDPAKDKHVDLSKMYYKGRGKSARREDPLLDFAAFGKLLSSLTEDDLDEDEEVPEPTKPKMPQVEQKETTPKYSTKHYKSPY